MYEMNWFEEWICYLFGLCPPYPESGRDAYCPGTGVENCG